MNEAFKHIRQISITGEIDDNAIAAIRGLAPGCAVNVFEAKSQSVENIFISRPDTSTGFLVDRDFSNWRLLDAPGDAYRTGLREAYSAVALRNERVSFVDRFSPMDGRRAFWRILVHFVGRSGRRQIMALTKPEAFETAERLITEFPRT